MKKLLPILFLFLFISCASDKPTDASGKEGEVVSYGSQWAYPVNVVDYYAAGMHYKVFNSDARGNIFVINITLDSINCAKK